MYDYGDTATVVTRITVRSERVQSESIRSRKIVAPESSGVGKRPATKPFGIKFCACPIVEACPNPATGRLLCLRRRSQRVEAGNTLKKLKLFTRY